MIKNKFLPIFKSDSFKRNSKLLRSEIVKLSNQYVQNKVGKKYLKILSCVL